jgi:hypothetical protein
MSYDQKKGVGVKLNYLTPDHKSFEIRGQMKFDLSMLYTVEKILSRAIR